jgi:hypothetical protein
MEGTRGWSVNVQDVLPQLTGTLFGSEANPGGVGGGPGSERRSTEVARERGSTEGAPPGERCSAGGAGRLEERCSLGGCERRSTGRVSCTTASDPWFDEQRSTAGNS